jgi:hypothetical protein
MKEIHMAKHNWEEHKKRYVEEYPELTLAAYAALFGLNPSTARRAMRGVKSTAKGNLVRQPKRQQKSDHSTGNDHLPSDHPTEEPKVFLTTKNASKTIKSRRYKRKPLQNEGGYIHKSDHFFTAPPLVGNTENDHPRLSGSMTPDMENLTAQSHIALYASLLNLDHGLLKAAIELAGDDEELVLPCVRYLQLYSCKESAIEQVKSDYAKGEMWYYPGTMTPMTQEMALMQAKTAPAQRLAELERLIGVRKTALWRQRQVECEQHSLTMKERTDCTTQILLERKKNGWSALETAQKLELKGLALPYSLRMEVVREVSFIEPSTDTDGGISEAELEAQAQAYMADQKEVMGNWLPLRQSEVAKALANEIAHQSSKLIDEDDFNPQHDNELSVSDSDDEGEGEPFTAVTEA